MSRDRNTKQRKRQRGEQARQTARPTTGVVERILAALLGGKQQDRDRADK